MADEAEMRGKGPLALRSIVLVYGTELANPKNMHLFAENRDTAQVRYRLDTRSDSDFHSQSVALLVLVLVHA